MKRQRPNFLRWIVTAVLLLITVILAIQFVEFGEVITAVRGASPGWMLLASLLLLIGMLLFALRWRYLLSGKPGVLECFHAANIGHILNIVVPLRAGEVARILVLGSGERVAVAEVTASFLVERIYEQALRVALLLLAVSAGSLIEISGLTLLIAFSLILLAFAMLSWAANRREQLIERLPPLLSRLPGLTASRARRLLSRSLDGLSAIASPGRSVFVLLFSLVIAAVFWGVHYLILLALPLQLTVAEQLAISLGALALAPPSAPTQPGIYQVAIVAPLALAGFDSTSLTSFALLAQTLQVVWMGIFGIWGLNQTGFSARSLLSRDSLQSELPG